MQIVGGTKGLWVDEFREECEPGAKLVAREFGGGVRGCKGEEVRDEIAVVLFGQG